MNQRKKILIITEIPFWRQFAGHTARLSSLVNYLKAIFDLTIIFGGQINDREFEIFCENYMGIRMVPFNTPRLGPANFAYYVKRFLNVHHFEACLIEYVELSYLLDSIPDRIKIFLDTHDLKSTREREFAMLGLKHEKFTWKEEIEVFKQYNKVLMIQKPDYLKVSGIIGKRKTLLVSHAVSLPRQKIRRRVERIGFIASSYLLNIEGLSWFLDRVWRTSDFKNYQLDVFGSICNYKNYFKKLPNVNFMGPFNNPDEAYSKVDVLINPVRLGSGIKIKNIEALGSGIPLVTTDHAAIGLEDLSNTGFLTACDSEEFRDKLKMLIGNYKLRKVLSDKAYSYISEFFSPESCYGPLERSINEL